MDPGGCLCGDYSNCYWRELPQDTTNRQESSVSPQKLLVEGANIYFILFVCIVHFVLSYDLNPLGGCNPRLLSHLLFALIDICCTCRTVPDRLDKINEHYFRYDLIHFKVDIKLIPYKNIMHLSFISP